MYISYFIKDVCVTSESCKSKEMETGIYDIHYYKVYKLHKLRLFYLYLQTFLNKFFFRLCNVWLLLLLHSINAFVTAPLGLLALGACPLTFCPGLLCLLACVDKEA
jgi:hypothetical protein